MRWFRWNQLIWILCYAMNKLIVHLNVFIFRLFCHFIFSPRFDRLPWITFDECRECRIQMWWNRFQSNKQLRLKHACSPNPATARWQLHLRFHVIFETIFETLRKKRMKKKWMRKLPAVKCNIRFFGFVFHYLVFSVSFRFYFWTSLLSSLVSLCAPRSEEKNDREENEK